MEIRELIGVKLAHLDLNLLKVFDAILTHGSLTLAGDSLGISQPAVSHALRRLRAAYNDELFFRSPEGMMPTPFASEIAAHVRSALEKVNLTIRDSSEFDVSESTRHFRFHMGDLAEALVTPVLLRSMGESAPKMSIEVIQGNITDTIKMISTGLLDFAIERELLESRSQSTNVQSQLIWEDDFVCAVRNGHTRLADIKQLTLNEYLSASHISAWSLQNTLCDVDSALKNLGMKRRIVFQSQYFLDAPTAAKHSDCLLTIPRSLALYANLKIFELPFHVPKMKYCLYSLQECPTDQPYNWMRDLILGLFRDCMTARGDTAKQSVA